jgi:hypothetical protein
MATSIATMRFSASRFFSINMFQSMPCLLVGTAGF